MRVLDLDLDFFQEDVAHFVSDYDGRLDSDNLYVYDGSSLESVKRSLASVLNISEDILIEKIVYYYCENLSNFDDNEFLYEEFIDYLGLEDEDIRFDYIEIFHIISTIDNLDTVKEVGLIDLRKTLTKETSLNNYLKGKGIEFNVNNDGIYIIINGNGDDLSKYNKDDTLTDKEYWKAFHGEYLAYRLSFDYNINGFLYLDNVYKDSNYIDLKNESEFLNRLKSFLDTSDLLDSWNEKSECYILKCRVKTGQVTLGNGLKWKSEIVEAKKLTKQLIEISIRIIIDFDLRKDKNFPIQYLLVKDGIDIPFNDIKVIEFKELGDWYE